MSKEFHYVRIQGDKGGVDAIEGPAIGLDLESILKDGLPPFKVALEIISACCEILDIAEQDGEVHGDIQPKFVFIDDTGAVSLEGWGVERRKTLAPEGSPKGAPTDLYGLGYLAYRLFSAHPLGKIPDDNPDAHDDAVVDSILKINFEGLNEAWIGDLQWYLAKLMSFDREDRPGAVTVWRTFIAFSDEANGPDFIKWCAAAVDGAGDRRDMEQAKKVMAAPPVEEEDLGGPVAQKGPLAKGLDLVGSAPKGQATAFWSKDAMKAALAKKEEEDAEEEVEDFKPAVGGGAATSFWSKDQMDAMSKGGADAPRPKRKEDGAGGKSPKPPTMIMRKDDVKAAGGAPKGPPPKPDPLPKAPPPPKNPPPNFAQGPTGPTPNFGGPLPPPPLPPPDAPSGGGNTMIIVGGIVLLLLLATLACVGVGGLGGLAVILGQSPAAPPEPEPEPKPAPAPKPKKDTGTKPKPAPEEPAPGAKPKPGDKPKPKPAPAPSPGPKPTPAPGPKPSPVPSPSPSPAPAPAPGSKPSTIKPKPGGTAPAPAPAPAPAGGPAKVTLKSNGRGSVSCGEGQSFDGSVTFNIEEYEIPATCLVTIDGKRGVFQVYGSGTVTCNNDGGQVNCDKSRIP